MSIIIIGIESSCDDTASAVIKDGYLLSNIIAGQEVHKAYGGVVPELASRAHQQNIIPVVDLAIKTACITKKEISAIAFTRGPGLLGSLLVGSSFSKGFAQALNIPLIEVNHLQAHIMVHFILSTECDTGKPDFPFLCLLVSGGHTQLVLINDYLDMTVIGETIDDAAGETFDKCAKIMGLPYPGGPLIDKLASEGNPDRFTFSKPNVKGLNFSFSGLKTSFLYFIRDRLKEDAAFIEKNISDLSASLQKTIIDILLDKLTRASAKTGVRSIALAGGVSANSALRDDLINLSHKKHWKTYIPRFSYTTDNAAMIAITGYYKYQAGLFSSKDVSPLARFGYERSV